MFALGMGLLLSTAAVYFADMLPVYEVLLVIWMYATPIIYPIEIVPPQLAWLLKLNPLYYMITIFRQPLFEGTIPDFFTWLIASACAVTALVLGGLVFTSRSHEYAYRI
jgi:ABC-type polysaccharide/polyol phosphate export permease